MPAKSTRTSQKTKTNAHKKTQHQSSRKPGKKQGLFETAARKIQRYFPTRRATGNRSIRHQGLSLDRKIDLVGVVMVGVGILLMFNLFGVEQGIADEAKIPLLRLGFGWGAGLLPVLLLVVGLWLILRNFDRIPQVSLERIAGALLLFNGLLSAFHGLLFLPDSDNTLATGQQGKGGGWLGALLFNLLRSTLGLGGAWIALFAWLVIALTMMLDVPVAQLFKWLPDLLTRMQDAWDDYREKRSNGMSKNQVPSSPLPAKFEARIASHTAVDQPMKSIHRQGSEINSFNPSHTPPTNWILPVISDILEAGAALEPAIEQDQDRSRVIEETLASCSAPARVVEVKRGPTITLFGVEPDFIESRSGRMRVRVGKIASLADDLALALSARTIRIQAPVPGKGYVGIEVPNDQTNRVALRDVIESEAFRRLKSPLRFSLGQDVAGNAVAADLAAMPHLLIAGTTGSGKSVCVNSLICCLLLHNTPNELRLIMVDPKRVELSNYNGIPHLLSPVVVSLERVVGTLQWVTREMDKRYHKLAETGARNIVEYNARCAARGERPLPYLVVFIDELADLMMLAPDETERTITRLAQLARATGIHLVIATQRPSVDVVTGLIKANFPARVAFAVASGVDSRVILDQPGAERLLGRGDMLFQAPDAPAAVRLQGTYVSDAEIQSLVDYWRQFAGAVQTEAMAAGGRPDMLPGGLPLKQIPLWEEMEAESNQDPLYLEAIDLTRRQGRASISMLQRHLRIGYTRAARLIETMEEKGIVGPPAPGTGTREVLDYGPAAPPVE